MNYSSLISAVRLRPELYDKSNPGFKNALIKQAAWKSVASEVNSAVPTCQLAWRNVRDRFSREYRLNKQDYGSGADNNKPRWPYYDSMQFLKSHICMRSSNHNKRKSLPTSCTSPMKGEIEYYMSPSASSQEDDAESVEGTMLKTEYVNVMETSMPIPSATPTLPYLGRKKRNKTVEIDSTASMFQAALSKVMKSVPDPPTEPLNEPDALIAKNVQYCLKSLKNASDIIKYRRKFRELIDECEEVILRQRTAKQTTESNMFNHKSNF